MANNKVVSTSSVSRMRPTISKTKQVTTKMSQPRQRSSNYTKSSEAPYDAKQYGNISFGRTGMTGRS